MAYQEQKRKGNPTAIERLMDEADKRGFALVEKDFVKGYTKNGAYDVDAKGVGKYIEHAIPGLFKPVDHTDFQAVCDATEKYYRDCETADIVPSMAGLCLRLGISKTLFSLWKAGKKGDHRYKELAERCAMANEAITSELALQNRINNIAAIVQLKNNYGYTDEQKVVVESGKESVVDDSLQMADVLAIADSTTPEKARYKELDKPAEE
jgi:hypothetical protein